MFLIEVIGCLTGFFWTGYVSGILIDKAHLKTTMKINLDCEFKYFKYKSFSECY